MSMIDQEKLRRENPGLKYYDALAEVYEKVREELGLSPDGEDSTETASVCTQDLEMYRQPVFNVSYDLSEVDCLNDPEDLYEELRAIRRLYVQYEDTKVQQEIEKARQIDEEYFANKPQGPVAGSSDQLIVSPKNSTLLSRIKHSFKNLKRFLCM
ncbi:hypothetical protein AAF712_003423 [Marasmius tenuissimus]|uniref:Uncharacterized protein n=1 Tax=Marasmius tenuissimus TaxID=585030 RepID=A0ABR3A724_9AGAR